MVNQLFLEIIVRMTNNENNCWYQLEAPNLLKYNWNHNMAKCNIQIAIICNTFAKGEMCDKTAL